MPHQQRQLTMGRRRAQCRDSGSALVSKEEIPSCGRIDCAGTEVAAFLGVSWKASEAKAEADKRQSMDEFYAQAGRRTRAWGASRNDVDVGEVQRGLGLINKNLDLLDQKRIDVINATSQQQEQG